MASLHRYHSGHNTTMSNRIKELRKALGWSMETLAGKVGTTKSQISKLEKGERKLSQQWMDRLAQVLGCNPGDLLPNQKLKDTISVNISATASSTMGGWVQPLETDAQYLVTFKPPQDYETTEYTGITIEGQQHNEFSEGTDLIFCNTLNSKFLQNGKVVLVEEIINGKPLRSIGQLEITPQMICINFTARDHHFHQRKIYWQRPASDMHALGETATSQFEKHTTPPALPEVPQQSNNMRILGTLVKSIKNE